MKKIALTGNIACGKSTAEKIIKELNYPVIDCDDIVKELYQKPDIITLLSANFPEIILDNQINKIKLSEIIFGSEFQRHRLGNIIHPFVRNEIKHFFETNSNQEKVFVIIPLLFEAQMEKMFDIKILISSFEEIREKRLIERKSLLSNYAKQVIKSQMKESEKESLCDFVIKNNGTLKEFQNAVKLIAEKL